MAKTTASLERWSISQSAELYGIREWGAGYFNINRKGEVTVTPFDGDNETGASLTEIVKGLRARGMELPVLLRFSDILDNQVERLNESFRKAIKDCGYLGKYHGVFPIKVNQQEQVIREITKFGRQYHHGLEAGSKAELMIALTFMQDPEAVIVCNGYKDEEFIDLALYGQKMGLKVVIVLEMPAELEMVLDRAKKLKIRPLIGIRARLSTRCGGHWNESGGDRSVFGLNPSQIMDVVDTLRREKKLDCLQLLHYHLGSQIPNIRDIRAGVREASRNYVDLVREGAAMGYLDIGGGLAVDYDGSSTNYSCSRNYGLSEYCADVVETVQKVCDESAIQHPSLISESGRAIVAYYSVLVFDILDVSRFHSHGIPDSLPDTASDPLKNLVELARAITVRNAQESYHDAMHYRDDLRTAFLAGEITLRERALGEQIFWGVMKAVSEETQGKKYVPEEIKGLDDVLADIYYANFSVFQSLPDAWAIDQLFPIMPIHRLDERPSQKAIISDITCDCDGKLDKFIDLHDEKKTLPVHTLKANQPYMMAAFLVGAYQETLGDLHNLFGDTNVVSLRIEKNNSVKFTRELEGDTVADVLGVVEYDVKDMGERFRELAERAVEEERITVQDRRDIMEAYRKGMQGYTYFES
ncbi:MAG: biosynthetic arginine decarboxylase [Kiritimatiellaeota bacterium]|nr:biosynthetic arginine decarboxylase [Kiritimatiellota bacterium]